MNLLRIRKDSGYKHLSTGVLGIAPVKIIKRERVTGRLITQPIPVAPSLCVCSFPSDFAVSPCGKYIFLN